MSRSVHQFESRSWKLTILFSLLMVVTVPVSEAANSQNQHELNRYVHDLKSRLSRGALDSLTIADQIDSLLKIDSAMGTSNYPERADVHELLAFMYEINVDDSTVSDTLVRKHLVAMLDADQTRTLSFPQIVSEFPHLRFQYLQARLGMSPPTPIWKKAWFQVGASSAALTAAAMIFDWGPFSDTQIREPSALPGPPPPPPGP